jgi:hypothetical protein
MLGGISAGLFTNPRPGGEPIKRAATRTTTTHYVAAALFENLSTLDPRVI